MTVKNNAKSPMHEFMQEMLGELSKNFLLEFHRLHDALHASPDEFINGAGIKNKETGETTLYTLTIKAEPNVSPERLNQYAEESLILKEKYEQAGK